MDWLCILCHQQPAAYACICDFPLPKVCSGCDSKHKLTRGCHFALPVSAVGAIAQEHWLQWHNYLVGISKIEEKLRASLLIFDAIEAQVEDLFLRVQSELNKVKSEYAEQLRELRAAAHAAVTVAVDEVNAHVVDSTYSPTDPIVKSIFEAAACGNIGDVQLFEVQTHEVSQETLKQALGLHIETLVLGMPLFRGNAEVQRSQIAPNPVPSSDALLCVMCEKNYASRNHAQICEGCAAAGSSGHRQMLRVEKPDIRAQNGKYLAMAKSGPIEEVKEPEHAAKTCLYCLAKTSERIEKSLGLCSCVCHICAIEGIISPAAKENCSYCRHQYTPEIIAHVKGKYRKCHVCGLVVSTRELEEKIQCTPCRRCVVVTRKSSYFGLLTNIQGNCLQCSGSLEKLEQTDYPEEETKDSGCCWYGEEGRTKLRCGHTVCLAHRRILKRCRTCHLSVAAD